MASPDESRRDRAAAAAWVARRDRGLSAAEQDDYLQWLRDDPQRAALVARHEAALRRMQGLAAWQPGMSPEANPDLFAPRRRRRWLGLTLAAAAALALGFFVVLPGPKPERSVHVTAPAASSQYLRINEREALADGTVVELRDGSRIEVAFTLAERRVRLIGGEAHFTVAKNPDRPFIVEAGGVAVRAIGTAFNVRFDAAAVDVLVTEGRVQVETAADARGTAATGASVTPPALLVAASQRTVVSLTAVPVGPAVISVTPEEVKEALAWQAPRLQFHETPLTQAVAEFNRHNARTLVLGDPALGTMSIGGTFRADNVEGFVRLLEVTLGVRGEARGPHQIVLTRVP
uniref:FecR family protein n=1 Tax=Horticoccus sp. 23ND18S-11 TaxID=3391832 RepID=UPI0039C97FED